MAGRIDAGKAFMDELLSRIPEEKRAAVQDAIDDGVLEFVGDGTLRQQDYSRAMNNVREVETKQKAWWEQNQPLVEAARAAGIDPSKPVVPATVQPTSGVTKDEISRMLDEREAGAAAFISHTTKLAMAHFREFGEDLDVPKLMADPDLQKVGLIGVYDKTFGPKIAEKRKAAQDAATEAEVQRRVAEARRADLNKPLHLRDPGLAGSPLDALTEGTPGGADPVVDEATAFYEQLRAQRYASGGAQ